MPRRRSDDEVVNDVCDWFDDFGFEDEMIEGHMLGVPDFNVNDNHDDTGVDMELLDETAASPEMKVVAREMLDPSVVVAPSVEMEEGMRAQGMDPSHLTSSSPGQGLKDSAGDIYEGSSLPSLTPLVEDSTSDMAIEKDVEVVGEQGFDWDSDNVEEMDAQSPWTTVAMRRRTKRAMSSRNRKFRRLMKEASTRVE